MIIVFAVPAKKSLLFQKSGCIIIAYKSFIDDLQM